MELMDLLCRGDYTVLDVLEASNLSYPRRLGSLLVKWGWRE